MELMKANGFHPRLFQVVDEALQIVRHAVERLGQLAELGAAV